MKRIAIVLFLAISLLVSLPVSAYAAPTGYKEVKLTKKNAGKYITFKKNKWYDEFRDYDGYSFDLYSKLRKKGYYLYKDDGFAIKLKFTDSFRYKKTPQTSKHTEKYVFKSFGNSWRYGDENIYKYGKRTNVKFLKAKGKLIFVKPSNVIGVKKYRTYNDGSKEYRIKLRYPYDSNTSREYKRDKNGNMIYDENGNAVVDYYYITRYKEKYHKYSSYHLY